VVIAALLALVLAAASLVVPSTSPAGAGAAPKVLVLSDMVTGGTTSIEAQRAIANGYTVDLVDSATWGSMTAGEFDDYAALIIGDPSCTTDAARLAGPEATADVWGPVVDGNVIVIGTDPVLHAGTGDATKLVQQGIDFALDEPGTTGAYLDLSCVYHHAGSNVPVPVLDGLGSFTAIGATGLPGLNDVHITATHPALDGITDAGLSNWGNSVHNGFNTWPDGFEVLAMARDPQGSFVSADAQRGYPYILARGEDVEVTRALTLTPETETRPVGDDHTVTATLAIQGDPLPDEEIAFEVISGPQAGETGTGTTNISGVTTFTYQGTAAGTDVIVATWDSPEGLIESNEVTVTWTAEATTTTTTEATTTTTEGEGTTTTTAPAVTTTAAPAPVAQPTTRRPTFTG